MQHMHMHIFSFTSHQLQVNINPVDENAGFPLSWLQKIPELFQDPVISQQTAVTNHTHSMIAPSILEYTFITVTCSEGIAKKLIKYRTEVRGCIFWCLHQHHCPANCRALQLDFQDFPEPNSFFKTFQVLETSQTQFQEAWEPWTEIAQTAACNCWPNAVELGLKSNTSS